jgi:hypothetical protein
MSKILYPDIPEVPDITTFTATRIKPTKRHKTSTLHKTFHHSPRLCWYMITWASNGIPVTIFKVKIWTKAQNNFKIIQWVSFVTDNYLHSSYRKAEYLETSVLETKQEIFNNHANKNTIKISISNMEYDCFKNCYRILIRTAGTALHMAQRWVSMTTQTDIQIPFLNSLIS